MTSGLAKKQVVINKQVVVQTEQMIVFSAAHCDYYVMLSATQHGYLKLLVLSIGEAVKFSFTFGLYFTMLVRPQQFFPF